MAKVFRVTPKRVKRTNGSVLTPQMSVTVTTLQNSHLDNWINLKINNYE